MSDNGGAFGGPVWTAVYIVWGVALAAVLALLFVVPIGSIGWLVWVGWGAFAFSAVLGWVPILAFHRRGGVTKGRTYVHTTQLVTSGLYAIVRHPQYLAGDFLAVAVMCITQHWATLLAGGIAILTNRLSMIKADRGLVSKFGEDYRAYMARVPRANVPVGLWRWVGRNRASQSSASSRR